MNEQQLREIMWEALATDASTLSIQSGRRIIQKAIELAKEKGLLVSIGCICTEPVDICNHYSEGAYCSLKKGHKPDIHFYSTEKEMCSDPECLMYKHEGDHVVSASFLQPKRVMWDKNEPYGAIKERCKGIVTYGPDSYQCTKELDHPESCNFD